MERMITTFVRYSGMEARQGRLITATPRRVREWIRHVQDMMDTPKDRLGLDPLGLAVFFWCGGRRAVATFENEDAAREVADMPEGPATDPCQLSAGDISIQWVPIAILPEEI